LEVLLPSIGLQRKLLSLRFQFMLMVSHRNTEDGLAVLQSFVGLDCGSIADACAWEKVNGRKFALVD